MVLSLKKHIPSIITMANLSCGFLAILIADPLYSPLLIVLGAVFDLFDGMVARLLGVTSELGKQLDSLSDLVSFGVAPAYLYAQLMPSAHWTNYLGPLLIVVSGAMRLGIFNTKASSKYFEGLAIPSSGFFIVGIVLAHYFEPKTMSLLLAQPIVYIGVGVFVFAMNLISLKMFSFKSLGINITNKIMMGLMSLGIIILLIISPHFALPLAILWYIFLAVIMNIIKKTE